jgi:hypothetical protein
MNVISYLRDCLELEELDWRKLAEEIKAMLFRSPQPKILQDEIKHIQFSVVIEVNDEDDANDGDEELADLKTALIIWMRRSVELERMMIQGGRMTYRAGMVDVVGRGSLMGRWIFHVPTRLSIIIRGSTTCEVGLDYPGLYSE